MSAATLITSPGSPYLNHSSSSTRSTALYLFGSNPTCRTFSSTPQSFNHLTSRPFKRTSTFHGFKRFSPVMEWQDCTVKMEIDVPVSVAYSCYSDREAIPRWMPFISSVKILPEKPDLSRWSLKYNAFGRDVEFSWLARNMQEKITNLIIILLLLISRCSSLKVNWYFLFMFFRLLAAYSKSENPLAISGRSS